MDTKKLWNIFCLLLVANVAFGAQVTGRVIDFGTKQPVDFANVSVEKPSSVSGQPSELVTGTVTDEKGNFAIEVKDGKYVLVVSFMGYKESRKESGKTAGFCRTSRS